MHTIDHTADWREAHRHYIPVPEGARTAGTRVRWWQPLSESKQPRVAWALDDVHIGDNSLSINRPTALLQPQ